MIGFATSDKQGPIFRTRCGPDQLKILTTTAAVDALEYTNYNWCWRSTCKLTNHLFGINAQHTFFFKFFLILFIVFFLSVLGYCNLVNSHLKSSHWPDALKSMIFIFFTIIGPIKTGKTQSEKKQTSECFLHFIFAQCLFFIVITKKKREKYIAIINNKKETRGNWEILRLANKQSQHGTSTYWRWKKKGTKNKNKKTNKGGEK